MGKTSGETTVLVVDDDPSIRDLLRIHLGNAGYRVLLAEDAIVGGHMLVKEPPDLLLLDLDMPYMTGLEFLQALRSDGSLPKFPIVFLTANPEGRELAASLGAAGYLAKPILLNDLLNEVSKHLPGGRTPIG
ncbi:MAG TPA: response regulator [Burkholderiales bacterium]|jgi:two-component system chemotaxis response regulator CheY|nr:response regulator [Burkholderiales bacterium]